MKKPRSSKEMFDRILMGHRLEQSSSEIRRAFRTLGYWKGLPERERPTPSSDDTQIIEEHPDFERYVDQEIQKYTRDNPSIGQIMLSLSWRESHYNKPIPSVDMLPPFLRFSDAELSKNDPEPNWLGEAALRTEKDFLPGGQLRRKQLRCVAVNTAHLTTVHEDDNE